MAWPHDSEVAPVKGGNLGQFEAFGDGDDRGVGGSEREASATTVTGTSSSLRAA